MVYKVDRLTRSSPTLRSSSIGSTRPAPGLSSVTQSFNTATSMGRLTLHMLLSFAQFEREVTAERIRDKVAASKRKGLWMGGRVPLGYEKDERTLRINEAEAETVRTLYALYRKHETLRQVKAEADRLRLRCAFYLFIRQPMGRKSALRREIPWILRGFQGRLSC